MIRTHARRWLLGGTFTAFGLALLVFVARGLDVHDVVPLPVYLLAAVFVCIAGLAAGRSSGEPIVHVVREAEPPPPAARVSAYRGVAPPVTAAPARASARDTALVVFACMVFAATAAPLSLHLPRWIEVESVLGLWWIVWALVLAVVARRGAALADDHTLVVRLPWSRSEAPSLADPPPKKRSSCWCILDVLSAANDLEAIVFAVALVVVMGVALFGAWLVVEIVAPALFALAYLGVVRALRHASEYRGSTARAALAGAGWATAYVAPLAIAVLLVHLVMSRA